MANPTHRLRVTLLGGTTATIGVNEGSCGIIIMSERVRVNLCPRALGDRLLLDIEPGAPAIPQTGAPKRTSLLLESDTRVRALDPVPFDVEWLSPSPPLGSPSPGAQSPPQF